MVNGSYFSVLDLIAPAELLYSASICSAANQRAGYVLQRALVSRFFVAVVSAEIEVKNCMRSSQE